MLGNNDKEWQKIKDLGICSQTEFHKMVEQNPNGKCFRKYAQLPWSKDNFFFGTYDELQNYYKTTTKPPFYLAEKIGSKVGHLTIEKFFYNENHELIVQCKCDCGKEAWLIWEKVRDKRVLSCGCKNLAYSKGICSNNIVAVYGDIVKENWDYDKNCISPEQVSIHSKDSYWWKGYYESYLMPIKDLKANVAGTSFPEQTLLYFLSKKGIVVIHRCKIDVDGKKYEVDLFLPELNVAIEYDGVLWHKHKFTSEKEKNNALNRKGIFLIRVREYGLKETTLDNGLEIINSNNEDELQFLANAVTKIFFFLSKISKGVKFIEISKADILEKRQVILSRYISCYCNDNINKSWLINFWSQDNEIPSYLVSAKSKERFFFKCRCGKNIFISPFEIMVRTKNNFCDELTKNLTIGGICPFNCMDCCPRNVYLYSKNYLEECKWDGGHINRTNHNIRNLIYYYNSVHEHSHANAPKFAELLRLVMSVQTRHISDILYKFICNSKEKDWAFDMVYETIQFPQIIGYKNTSSCFRNDGFLSFYLEKYDYTHLLSHPKIFLNFQHNENIYQVCYAMIYAKDFDLLEKALELINKNLDTEDYNNFITNLFLQFYTREGEDAYNTVFSKDKNSQILFDILIKHCNRDTSEYIKSILQQDREEFRTRFLISYSKQLCKDGKFTEKMYDVLISRLAISCDKVREELEGIRKEMYVYAKELLKARKEKEKQQERAILRSRQNNYISYFDKFSTNDEKVKEIIKIIKGHYNDNNVNCLIPNSKFINVIIQSKSQNLGMCLSECFDGTKMTDDKLEEIKREMKKNKCKSCYFVTSRLSKNDKEMYTFPGLRIQCMDIVSFLKLSMFNSIHNENKY